MQTDKVRRLASTRLEGALQAAVQAAVNAAEDARDRRNNVVHQDWLLRSRDASRPWSEIEQLCSPEEYQAYLREWERESKDSEDWERVPRRGVNAEDTPSLAELVAVERLLSAATGRILDLVFTVASARNTGCSPGYVHPPERPGRSFTGELAEPRSCFARVSDRGGCVLLGISRGVDIQHRVPRLHEGRQ